MVKKALHVLGGWAYPTAFLTSLTTELSEHFNVSTHPFTAGHSSIDPSEPYILAGWSLGALHALQCAANNRVKPDALVLISGTARFCACDGYSCGVDRATLKSMQIGLRRDRRKTLNAFYALAKEPDSPAYDDNPGFSTDELFRGLRDLETLDMREALAAISVPTIILHGERDEIIPCAASKFLAEALPHATVFTHPDASHDLPHRHPKWVVGTILEFLR